MGKYRNTASSGRIALLDTLKRRGPLDAETLGKVLGVTAMAVRQHLYGLSEEGYIDHDTEAAARGRPRKLWRLTDKAQALFPDRHQDLALDLIDAMKTSLGPDGMSRLINFRGAQQIARYKAAMENAKTLDAQLSTLAQMRSQEGYMAEYTRDGDDWIFIENHCPICSAARACTGICASELEVFQASLGPSVSITREEHILKGARRCAYRVSRQR